MRLVALLRAVNVGRAQMTAATMRAVVSDLGYRQVVSYLQSGNVCFEADDERDAVRPALEEAFASLVGAPVHVLVRSASDLARLVAENPFVDRGLDPKSLHVTFLAAPPVSDQAPDGRAYAPDEFALGREEVFVHCPGGYGRTRLHNGFFERRFGTVATTRNWRTVLALAELTTT